MSGQPIEQGAASSHAIRFGPAVSLSYDGADPSHLEVAVPCLAEHDLRGTFYATETGLLENPKDWQAAQNEGHEIACHSLLEAADGLGNLPKWTLENVEADLRDARKLITELFPRQSDCSFAYPGVEQLCMSSAYEPLPTSYRPVVGRLFQVCRSALEGLIEPSRSDVQFLECVDARDLTLDDLLVAAEAAMVERKWAIFAFRGVGSGDGAIDAQAHEAFCAWLEDHRERIKVGTVLDLGMELREKRAAAEGAYSWSLSPSDGL